MRTAHQHAHATVRHSTLQQALHSTKPKQRNAPRSRLPEIAFCSGTAVGRVPGCGVLPVPALPVVPAAPGAAPAPPVCSRRNVRVVSKCTRGGETADEDCTAAAKGKMCDRWGSNREPNAVKWQVIELGLPGTGRRKRGGATAVM
jgi:hypothetical protein